MKILFYEHKTFPVQEYAQVLMSLGHEVKILEKDEKDANLFTDTFKTLFTRTLQEYRPDCVLCINYLSVLSDMCQNENVKYVCWVVDSPLLQMYSTSIYNKCNYLFIFDEAQYNEFEAKEVQRIYYLPLSVNTNRLDAITLNEADADRYASDVSFVGRLYNNNRYDSIKGLPAYVRGFVDGLIMAQLKVTGFNLVERSLTPYFVSQFERYGAFHTADDIDIPKEKLIAHEFIDRKCTQIDRLRTLNTISNMCDLTIFSDDNLQAIPKAKVAGPVSYIDEMPKVFKLSKINLSMTSKGIVTGIPLRVFDIVGAGGFLLTNYQFELEKYFEFGKDIVVYYNMSDLEEKIKYYLEHEQERLEIAHNGYMKVKQYHQMSDKLKYIMDTVMESN